MRYHNLYVRESTMNSSAQIHINVDRWHCVQLHARTCLFSGGRWHWIEILVSHCGADPWHWRKKQTSKCKWNQILRSPLNELRVWVAHVFCESFYIR